MRRIAAFLLLIMLISCKKEAKLKEPLYPKTAEELGKELFEDKGNCAACHQPDQKVIGPSIREIAKTYKAKNASIVTFLKGNAEPIVDPSQFEVMKTNFAITKAMTDEELQAIEAYMYALP